MENRGTLMKALDSYTKGPRFDRCMVLAYQLGHGVLPIFDTL